MTVHPITTAATDLHRRLEMLYLERAVARLEGLASNEAYMDDLEDEIVESRAAYNVAAVTEIATLLGELSGRPQG